MFKKLFKKKEKDSVFNPHEEVQNILKETGRENRIEDLDDSITILKEIQRAYEQPVGSDKEFKTYKARNRYILNFIQMSIEQLEQKKQELV